MRWIAIGMTLVVGGCGGGQRWLNPNKDMVDIRGIAHTVAWLQSDDQPGLIDFVVTPPIVFFPDVQRQERESAEAAAVVARKRCGHEARKLSSARDPSGFSYRSSFSCSAT